MDIDACELPNNNVNKYINFEYLINHDLINIPTLLSPIKCLSISRINCTVDIILGTTKNVTDTINNTNSTVPSASPTTLYSSNILMATNISLT